MPRIPLRTTEFGTKPCSISASPRDCVFRNWLVSASTTLNWRLRMPVSWCGEKAASNAACHCGRKRCGRCGLGWPYAVPLLHPRSS